MSEARDNTSLWSKLTPDQREELCIALYVQRCGLEGGLTLVKSWKVAASMSAVHRFFHAERSGWTLDRAKRFAVETQGMLPEDMDKAQRSLVQQRVFELASSPEVSAKELLKLRDQEIKLIMLQQADRKLKLLEDKVGNANAAMESKDLTPEEKIARWKQVFGR